MKWPWVSRVRYEMELTNVRGLGERIAKEIARTDAAEARFAAAEARYDALLEKYHALRVSGANPKEPPVVVPPPKQPPAPIMRAIRLISPREDAAFFANMRLYRENEAEADADPEKFAERIKRGRLTSTDVDEHPRAD